MRIINWNINGVRSIVGKIKNGAKTGSVNDNVITSLFKEYCPDILCFQEVKTQNSGDLACFKSYFKNIYTDFSKHKKGYSGVALMTNLEPDWISYDLKMFNDEQLGSYDKHKFIDEGRIITAKFTNVVVVTVYVPNSKTKLARLGERVEWEILLRKYLQLLKEELNIPIILCGDLNVAHKEIDVYDTKGKHKLPGFSPEERDEFQKLLDIGFTDTFRHLYPDIRKYSYFSNFANTRANNRGWRIDMILVSNSIKEKITGADILQEFYGSDHTPVLLDISVSDG